MLHVFDSRFRFQSHAGPSVTFATENSALNLLFPAVGKLKSLDMELLQLCISKSARHLPKDVVRRMTLDDMEHSACEWMRALRYGILLPLPDHRWGSNPKKTSTTNTPKSIGFELREIVLECSNGAMDHYQEE